MICISYPSMSVRVAAALLLLVSTLGSGHARTLEEVQDLHYGKTLYYFFQEKYFTSASELLTAIDQNRLTHHKDEAQLLLGGLYLSYGLFNEAEAIFQQLVDKLTNENIRNRAWFQLADIFYQRKQYEKARDALQRIQGSLSDSQITRKAVIAANILMAQDQHDKAVLILEQLTGDTIWNNYATFNLGIALIRLNQFDKGKVYLNRLGTLDSRDLELRALKDKANLALGYAALRNGLPQEAEIYFTRVRLRGPYSNQGLYGMAHSLFGQKQYEDSLSFWQELKNRSTRGPAVFEALLMTPNTYIKLGAYGQALQGYQEAVDAYDQEIQQTRATIAEVNEVNLLDKMMNQEIYDELDWLWRPGDVPDPLRHHFITQLLASHEFNEAMRNYRDLLFFTSHLKRWQTNMDSFDTMLAARQQAYQERLPRILDRYNLDYIDSLNTRYTGLAQRVDAIRQNENALALADNQERQYLAILKRVEQRIGLLNDFPGDDAQEYQDKYQRLYGVLTWNIRTDFKPRLHQVSKSLNQTRRTLGQVKRSQASLQQAQREAPQRFNDFRNRIDTLTQRIDVLADKLDGLSQRQVQAIRDLAVRKLQAHQAKLEDYKVRAQFAMAQIYDLTATSPTVETRDPGEDSPSQTEPPTTR